MPVILKKTSYTAIPLETELSPELSRGDRAQLKTLPTGGQKVGTVLWYLQHRGYKFLGVSRVLRPSASQAMQCDRLKCCAKM
ncbi:MAG: hypothetical protein LRZ84_18220 [Desertifilum sp.]|nr:hypothetical protein [Desertifilum sp.]